MFETLAARTYVVWKTAPVYSGSKESGRTYVDYTQYLGSQAPVHYQLDAASSTAFYIVARDVSQVDAAFDLTVKLLVFLNSAIDLFSSTGGHYSVLKQQTNATISGLQENIAAFTSQMNLTGMELQQKQNAVSSLEQDFHKELSIWLPLLFLVPPALMLIVYYVMSKCCSPANTHESTQEGEHEQAARNPLQYR
jgi:hypothetical protein